MKRHGVLEIMICCPKESNSVSLYYSSVNPNRPFKFRVTGPSLVTFTLSNVFLTNVKNKIKTRTVEKSENIDREERERVKPFGAEVCRDRAFSLSSVQMAPPKSKVDGEGKGKAVATTSTRVLRSMGRKTRSDTQQSGSSSRLVKLESPEKKKKKRKTKAKNGGAAKKKVKKEEEVAVKIEKEEEEDDDDDDAADEKEEDDDDSEKKTIVIEHW